MRAAVGYPRAANATFPVDAERGVPVHPTQVYDSLLSLGLYLFLAWLYRRKKFDGQVFAAYLICYAFTRSFVEYFRGDYTAAHLSAGLFTPAQMISVGILITGVALAVVLWRANSKSQTSNPK
jgi:phosphatidylglycerol---prolipoprotein diacylglyceryl transferase